MRDAGLLDIDLSASLWVLGAFAASMLALHFADRLAHTRARNRTRLAIEKSTQPMQDNAENTTNSRAME
jgi:hypothetical protein